MYEALRQQLVRSLDPRSTEILIACAASAVTGLPVHHAKSGFQFGADATGDGLKIEVKAYLDEEPRDVDLLGKLLQGALDGANPPEIWVLAATRPCSSQTVDGLREAGRRLGIQVAVLDWQPGPLPALLALLAAASEAVLAWISCHCPELQDAVRAGLEDVKKNSRNFSSIVADLNARLTPTLASYVATRKAMADCYYCAFADRSRAMTLFGQALTPLSAPGCIDRAAVFGELDAHLRHDPVPLVVLGEEGVGKTWVVASYWYRRAPDALCVLIPSRLALRHARGGAQALLQAALRAAVAPAGADTRQWSLDSWQRRVDVQRRLLVVLDGLNEQPSLPWPGLIREMQGLLTQIGGRLILTCRPRFWDRELRARFGKESFRSVLVEGFDGGEFREALRRSGHDPERFSPELHSDLRNPRIFGLASELLDSLDPSIGPITRERVLWQYWLHRRKERDDIVLTDDAFRELLIRHAHSAWAEIQGDSRRAWHLRGQELPLTRDALEMARGESIEQLTADLLDVADGKFFRLVTEGLKVRHAFEPDKLWYALGLRLAYEAHDASEVTGFSEEDTREIVARILEPIIEMDVATDILLAAFAVSVLHPRLSRSVARWFLVELAELRNRHDGYPPCRSKGGVSTYIAEAPEVYVDAADALLSTPVVCDDWIIDALRRGLQLGGSTRQLIEDATRKWLRRSETAQSRELADAPADAPANVVLALRMLAGHPCENLLDELGTLRDSEVPEVAELAAWLCALDEVTPWPDGFINNFELDLSCVEPRPETDGHPNDPLLKVVAEWRQDPGHPLVPDFDTSAFQVFDGAQHRLWNLALAPSLPGCMPAAMVRTMRRNWHTSNDLLSQTGIVECLLESALVGLPLEERVGFLTGTGIPVDASTRDDTGAFLPSLGESGADRYLYGVLTAAGYPGLDPLSPQLGAVRLALDLLQGAAEVELGDECQNFLLDVILDRSYPRNFRVSAREVAARCRGGGIALRLTEKDWSATEEEAPSPETLNLEALLTSTVAVPGLYPRIRDQLSSGGMTAALEIVADQDWELLVADLDHLVRAYCATMSDEETPVGGKKPGRSLQRASGLPSSFFTRAGLERLLRKSPDVFEGWVYKLEALLDQVGSVGNLDNLAYSLLPVCAVAEPVRAAQLLGRLLDVLTQEMGHQGAQQSIEHRWFYQAFSTRQHAALDEQLERMIRTCADDESLSIAVDAACASGRLQWLADFVEREVPTGRVGRVARARYVMALAGLPTQSIAGRGCTFWDSVERAAARVEMDRAALMVGLEQWKSARTPEERWREELAMFDALTGFYLRVDGLAEFGELGELLQVRLSQAVFDARTRLSRQLFGLNAPPGWMVFGNVPPRCGSA